MNEKLTYNWAQRKLEVEVTNETSKGPIRLCACSNIRSTSSSSLALSPPLYLCQSFPSFSCYIPLSPLIQYSAYHYRYTERTSFTVHPDNEMWTLARQTGFYEIDLMFGVDQVIHQTIMRPK